MSRRILLLLVPVVLAIIGAFGAMSAMTAMTKEPVAGDPAPDFALPGSDGRIHRLSAMRGKVVVIAWFPKAFTGG